MKIPKMIVGSRWHPDRDNYLSVYIGRGRGRGKEEGPYGNPFPAGQYGREKCLLMYKKHIEDDPRILDPLYQKFRDGKNLFLKCYCKKEVDIGPSCHGDIIKETFTEWLLLEALYAEFKLTDFNVSSSSTGMGYALTNPTHSYSGEWYGKGIRKPKVGQVTIHDYLSKGIMYNDTHYIDVEDAYKQNKYNDNDRDFELMVKLIVIKFETYPILITSLDRQGGRSLLNSVRHAPTGGKTRWETGNLDLFKKALIQAYEIVKEKD